VEINRAAKIPRPNKAFETLCRTNGKSNLTESGSFELWVGGDVFLTIE